MSVSLQDYLKSTVGCWGGINESSASPTSDNAIYYKIGLHKYNWNKSKKAQLDKKYDISASDPRPGIIRYAKDVMCPILKDSEEIIHRNDWDLDGLIGETEYQLMHPHYWTLNGYVAQSHKRKHDILVVMECGNTKPYAVNKAQKIEFTDKYRAFADFACISNPGIIPLEYSQFYPYRYDEWDHFAEKADIAWKYTWVCAARFLAYKKHMGYKKVIVLFQTMYPQEWAEWLYKENIDNCRDWLIIVHTRSWDKRVRPGLRQKFGNDGLVNTRLIHQPVFREKFEKDLKSCLSGDERKEFEKLQDILKMESRHKRAQALEEFNKEHDVQPYEPTKGTSDTYKMKTDSDTTKSEVTKNEKFVEKFIEELPDRYKKAEKDDKKWHKHLVVFTALDLLMLQHKDALVTDPDQDYWNMWEAVKKQVDKHDDIIELNSYCYVYKPLVDELKLEKVKKYCNRLGITQFWDDRRKSPDK